MKTKTTQRILNCVPSASDVRDWLYEDAVSANFTTRVRAIPKSVDLREKWWTVNDQGDTGSCVGWATADSLMRWHFVQNKLLKMSDLLSVRFIWMSAKETDEFNTAPSTFLEEAGTSLKAALDIARVYGCVTDKDLPFGQATLFKGTARSFYARASRYKILNYFNLAPGNGNKLQQWKQWIAAGNGPILTRLDVDDVFANATATKGKLEKFDTRTADGGHAVSIVGYTPEHFIVRNSWGTEWGDKGFAYASYDYADAAFTEAFGVNV